VQILLQLTSWTAAVSPPQTRSHVDAVLTSITAHLGPSGAAVLAAPGNEGDADASAPSLLANGSFEDPGDGCSRRRLNPCGSA
jgi:hypothetical protein